VATYLDHVEALQARSGPIPADDRDLRAIIALAGGPLLAALDAVVERYQAESETEVAALLRAESAVVVMTLAALLVEALLIFRPMMHRVVAERERLIEQKKLKGEKR